MAKTMRQHTNFKFMPQGSLNSTYVDITRHDSFKAIVLLLLAAF